MTKKQTKRFATYLLLFLLALITLTLVRLMFRRRHESWWFFMNDEKDGTTTTVAPLTTTVAPNANDLEQLLTGEHKGPGILTRSSINENEFRIIDSVGTNGRSPDWPDRTYLLSKIIYQRGTTVSCEIRTDGRQAQLFMVPVETYDDLGFQGVKKNDGITYGCGYSFEVKEDKSCFDDCDTRPETWSLLGILDLGECQGDVSQAIEGEDGEDLCLSELVAGGTDLSTVLSAASQSRETVEYLKYELQIVGPRTISYVLNDGAPNTYEIPALIGGEDVAGVIPTTQSWYIGVVVESGCTADFKNFEITPPPLASLPPLGTR